MHIHTHTTCAHTHTHKHTHTRCRSFRTQHKLHIPETEERKKANQHTLGWGGVGGGYGGQELPKRKKKSEINGNKSTFSTKNKNQIQKQTKEYPTQNVF